MHERKNKAQKPEQGAGIAGTQVEKPEGGQQKGRQDQSRSVIIIGHEGSKSPSPNAEPAMSFVPGFAGQYKRIATIDRNAYWASAPQQNGLVAMLKRSVGNVYASKVAANEEIGGITQ